MGDDHDSILRTLGDEDVSLILLRFHGVDCALDADSGLFAGVTRHASGWTMMTRVQQCGEWCDDVLGGGISPLPLVVVPPPHDL